MTYRLEAEKITIGSSFRNLSGILHDTKKTLPSQVEKQNYETSRSSSSSGTIFSLSRGSWRSLERTVGSLKLSRCCLYSDVVVLSIRIEATGLVPVLDCRLDGDL